MNPYRLALFGGLLLLMPAAGWLLSILGAQAAPADLTQAALLLSLFQLALVMLLLPGLAAGGPPLTPALLLFLLPAPLALMLILTGAEPVQAGGAQAVGLLSTAGLALPWPRLAGAGRADGTQFVEHLAQTGLLVALCAFGTRLLAVGAA
ncbi:hypothetical protein CKO31_05310 [Thiohalocapsa halophila]|uniref:Uncharacterized protein n=1 Tax=Thiohalocapsa halophila TaxID=69359 RepID=A0ABS1CE67_9GAMM|nr:hypothetical protein [Thiohalocapsa halophila]MBK1630169.1 hypothetical protein [Thiohalocapsa halophila]